MKIEKINTVPPEPLRCEAFVTLQTKLTRRAWNEHGHGPYEEDHCNCFAKYMIDGKPMCKKHAAYYALEKLTRE